MLYPASPVKSGVNPKMPKIRFSKSVIAIAD